MNSKIAVATHHAVPARDFSKQTLKQLALKGIRLAGCTFIPGVDGSFANGERAYELVVGGCQYLRTHAQVKVCAASSWNGEKKCSADVCVYPGMKCYCPECGSLSDVASISLHYAAGTK